MHRKEKIIAVIPVFNEEDYILDTINGLKKIKIIQDIVVIDDGSTDDTLNKLSEDEVTIIKLNKNYGKGYAIRKAIKELDYDYIVLLDGDLGESSKEIIKLINPVINDKTDFAIAKFPKPKKKGGVGLVKGLAKFTVLLYTGRKIDTSLSGQRVYKAEVVKNMKFIPDRFGIEVAMTVAALRKGYRVKEINVNMSHRETGRDLKGFLHRGKQFCNILKTSIILFIRR